MKAERPRIEAQPRLEPGFALHRPMLTHLAPASGREARPKRTIVPITLQGTAGGFSAAFITRLPELEQAMAAHGLDANDFIISKDNSASSNARPLGPFFYDYTVFVGPENFTVTEPNDLRFFDYFLDRILAADQAPAPLPHDTLFSRFAKWMAQPI